VNIWTRLGISVALLGIFCIVCSEMIRRDGYYDQHRREIAGGLCGAGAVAFLIGRVLNRRAVSLQRAVETQKQEEEQEQESDVSGQPFILFNLAYWGPILMAFGLVVLFIPAKGSGETPVAARAPVVPKPKLQAPFKTNVAAVELKQTNQVSFPAVKLQGITQRAGRSSALINGKTYFLGERVGEAKLISIFEQSVVLELGGELRSVTLRK
jgi:hypothetical protein